MAAIAADALKPDAGSVRSRGTVGLVHQHFELLGRLTVWQNVLLGREPRKGPFIDARAARASVRALAIANGLHVNPDRLVEELPVGVQQRVELLRALEREPAVLLLDEPTAALAPAEIEAFFATVARLAARGAAILVITHKLQEAIAYSSRVTVIRGGQIVARFETSRTNAEEIAGAMVGGALPAPAQRALTRRTPCLSVAQLHAGTAKDAIEDITFEVASGEIVAIAGIEGNGQTMLADALAGAIPYGGGITVHRPAQTPQSRPSLAIIPQDRRREGLVLQWSLTENAALGRQRRVPIRRGALIDRAAARADAQTIVNDFDVRAASLDAPAATLSGGNQQKIVVGRALLDEPLCVLAYQPTRGIDVGAAALVQSHLVQARNRGAAIVLISFDLDEVLGLADRVLVIFRGRIAGAFERGRFDRERIGAAMGGIPT